MSVKIGDFGGIRFGEEAVAYGTLAASMVDQHARAAPAVPKKALQEQPRLSGTMLATRQYATGYTDGEFEVAYDDSRAVVGPILACCGALSTDDYTIGDGGTPDTESLSAQVAYGNSAADGSAMQALGCVPTHLRWTLAGNEPVVLTLGALGRMATQPSAFTPSPPSEAGIVYESDYTASTIGGTTVCILSANIEQQFQIVGADRKCLATSVLRKPVRSGRVLTTAQLMVELADDTGADTEAILAQWYAGTALGDIVIGDLALGTCYMVGDPPALQAGIIQFPINIEASALVVTTTA